MALVPFKVLPHCWSPDGVSLSKTVWGALQEARPEIPQLFLLTQPQRKVMGTYAPGTETLGLLGWCGAEIPSPEISLHFISTTHGLGTRPLHISAPTTHLAECGLFISLVVRHPSSLIFLTILSDSCSSLVVTLLWLC